MPLRLPLNRLPIRRQLLVSKEQSAQPSLTVSLLSNERWVQTSRTENMEYADGSLKLELPVLAALMALTALEKEMSACSKEEAQPSECKDELQHMAQLALCAYSGKKENPGLLGRLAPPNQTLLVQIEQMAHTLMQFLHMKNTPHKGLTPHREHT